MTVSGWNVLTGWQTLSLHRDFGSSFHSRVVFCMFGGSHERLCVDALICCWLDFDVLISVAALMCWCDWRLVCVAVLCWCTRTRWGGGGVFFDIRPKNGRQEVYFTSKQSTPPPPLLSPALSPQPHQQQYSMRNSILLLKPILSSKGCGEVCVWGGWANHETVS